MAFRHEEFELIDWIVQNISGAKYDLTSTGLDPPRLMDLGIEVKYERFAKEPQLAESIGQAYGVPSTEVLATSGCTLALYLIFATLLRPNDEVIVQMPNYPPLYKVPRVLGAKVTEVRMGFKGGFKLDLDALEKVLSKKTRMLVLTNSNNPTGVRLTKSDLEEIANITARTGTFLLVDETFREFAVNPAPLARNLGNHVLSTNTLAKYFGMGDLKVGWIIAKKDLIQKIQAVNKWVSINVAPLSARVASQIFENKKKFDDRAASIMNQNLQIAKAFFKRTIDYINWVEPDGAPICFPKSKLPLSSLQLSKTLIDRFGILVSPGEFFESPGHFRLSFAGSSARVEKGLDSLAKAFSVLSKEKS
ncbi:MAG: pyridoxal phosphate-dependent aminotransferase [Thaumarchaeota archaeon]|nr:pyridoxal phosphate-dependent aminotransferase [Nitrososphaerota archaeon]